MLFRSSIVMLLCNRNSRLLPRPPQVRRQAFLRSKNLETERIHSGLFESNEGVPGGRQAVGAGSSMKPERVRGLMGAIVQNSFSMG